MTTFHFQHVYVNGRGTAGGKLEKEGPIGSLFDQTFDDSYCGESTFEKAERALLTSAADHALRRAKLGIDDIDILVGGDLINQLTSSHYFARQLQVPFIGMYAACATSSLVIGEAAMLVEQGMAKKALAFTSSHTNTAERQFRFPNEYGIQKKPTTTLTVTGAGAAVLSNEKSAIKVTDFTIGKIIDWNHTDPNDMGIAMTPAALDTLLTHFQDTKRGFDDYDLIVTGDLSKLGFSFLCDLLVQKGFDLQNKLFDCGMMVYDIEKQPVFCGGSGCASSMCVSMAKLLKELEEGKYRRIMVIATGALLSPVAVQQKESVPCIAHAIVYEREESR